MDGGSGGSARQLNWLNFLVADMSAAFGPFVPVALIQAGWSPAWVGYAVGAGGLAAMAGQVPAGALIDSTAHKRGLAACAVLALAGAALVLAWSPLHLPVVAALLLQGLAGVVLGPTIAALTLALSQQGGLGERLGSNARWQALGAAGAALALGLLGHRFGPRAVFVAAALLAIPALLAVRALRPGEAPRRRRAGRLRAARPAWPAGMVIFFVCTLLFFAGNAAILTLAAAGLAASSPRLASLLVPAAVVVPQALVALLSPWVGRAAQRWGRRPLLLLGLSMVPLRALLFALGLPPLAMVGLQALDGVGAAVFGVMLPLVVSDLTRHNGRFNLAYAGLGLAGTAGTAASNLVGGWVIGHAGAPAAFLTLAATGLLAMGAAALMMPETRPGAGPAVA
jgi:MFS family permease